MKTLSHLFAPALLVAAVGSGLLTVVAAQDRAARPPAPTLTRPATPAKAPDADGFLQRWLLLEPIRVNGQLTERAVGSDVETDALPGPPTAVPRDGDTVTIAGTTLAWHAVDTIHYNVNLFHFAYALDRPTSNVLFWAVTVVHAPREMTDVRLAIGSNAASIWWLNGQQVIALYNDRQSVIDDGVSKRVTLHQGANIIRAAVINAGGATDFCARFLDANDHPIRDLTVSLH
jgi:hypothetical protein